MEIRTVKEDDKVYWAERDHTGWIVRSGYFLAGYLMADRYFYIVSLGEVTSCVVRHLPQVYETRKEAWASIADKE